MSNYTIDHLDELLQFATVVPAVLQVVNFFFSILFGSNLVYNSR